MGVSVALVRIGAAVMLLGACSSAPEGTTTQPLEQRPSAERDPQAPCGDGPHVNLSVWLSSLQDDDTLGGLSGAKVAFDICPGYSVVTDEFGMATARVPRGVPFVTTLSAPDHVTSIVAQATIDEDSQLADFLPTLKMSGALPGWSPDAAVLAVYIDPMGSAACAEASGVSLRVADHPEARAWYMRPAWPFDPTPGTGSTSLGSVVIFTGIAEGNVRLEGTKPGCTIKQAQAVYPLQRGAFTVGNVFVDD